MRELPWNEQDPKLTWSEDSVGGKALGVYVFSAETVDAVNAALAANRPLLVRGEPGSGKSQLARAAAAGLKRPYRSVVVDSRTEADDLKYSFDAVSRLAQAQIFGAFKTTTFDEAKPQLHESKFLTPGPLWWTFDWGGAEKHLKGLGSKPPATSPDADSARGVVLLIDEIDKADPSLPNGLLEALDQRRFSCPGGLTVEARGAEPPLVIITTNEERSLPDPFLRRCLVLHLALPEREDDLRQLLVVRGNAHFPRAHRDVLNRVADLLIDDRRRAHENELTPPGCAEYLDLVRAVTVLRKNRVEQLEMLKRIASFALSKHSPRPSTTGEERAQP